MLSPNLMWSTYMVTNKPIALVTGSTQGIGKAISELLIGEGYKVIKHGKKKRSDKDYIQADLTKPQGVKKLIRRVKRKYNSLNLIVNNASYTKYIPYSNFRKLNNKLFKKILYINFESPFILSTQLTPLLKKGHKESNNAQIINIASAAGITGSGSNLVYAAAKGAIITFTKSLAKTIGPIKVNSISPGLIKTKFVKFPPKYYIMMKKNTPVGKVGEPKDIASVVKFLLNNKYVTGQNIVIDGGRILM